MILHIKSKHNIAQQDQLVILGSGGGRHHIRTQYRATGGILYKFNDIQAHIDPGPGAIVRINQYNEDPTKTELFIVSHFHLDHFNDISVIIESSRESLHDRKHTYYKKGTLLTTDEVLQYISDYHRNMLENIKILKPGEKFSYRETEIVATKIKHADGEGFGIRFNQKNYSLAYSSDTTVFEGFAEQFNGVDILILNLLRPDSVVCKRHLCTDEVIPYINKIIPPPTLLILNHFGAYMDSPLSSRNFIPSQVEKFEKFTKIKHIIAGEDGLKINLNEFNKTINPL